jgi:predicted RNA-binding Zn ribbon-like protein
VRAGVIDTAAANELRNLYARRGKAALGRAKTLREALYLSYIRRAPVRCRGGSRPPPKGGAAAQTIRVLVSEAGGFAKRWRATDSDTITHRIALAATDLITSPALGRVHVCPGDNCVWLFLDKSRSGDASGAAKKRAARAIAFGGGAADGNQHDLRSNAQRPGGCHKSHLIQK